MLRNVKRACQEPTNKYNNCLSKNKSNLLVYIKGLWIIYLSIYLILKVKADSS
jgi:hypothetical protein